MNVADVALQLDVGISDGAWTLLGPGFFCDLPVGLLVLGGDRVGQPFELAVPNLHDHHLVFVARPVDAEQLDIRPAPNQQVVDEVVYEDDATGLQIRCLEFAYNHDGARWRQRMYGVPLSPGTSLVVVAQATDPHAEALFITADELVFTISPATSD